MSFNPIQNYQQGFKLGEQQKTSSLRNQIASQIQQGGFDPSASLLMEELAALDPTAGARMLNTFQKLDHSRQEAFFKDARKGRQLLERGDFEGFRDLTTKRLNAVEKFKGDPADVMSVMQSFNAGDINGTINQLKQAEMLGVQGKFLQDLDAERRKSQSAVSKTAQEKNFDKLMELEKSGDVEQTEVFKKLLNITKDPKMSSKAETAVINAQDDYFKSGQQARMMEILANDISKIDIGGGLKSTVTETLKGLLGSQDEVTSLRKRFNAIRSSQATANLPPGAASDKDIEMALSGFPAESANAQQITSFLKGQAKLERINQKFQEFKAVYIGDNKKPSGLIKAWKQEMKKEGFAGSILNPSDPLKSLSVNELSDEDLFN